MDKSEKSEENVATQKLSLSPIWELDGFSQPETVYTFENHQWLYVSNPNEPNPGYLSRLSKDGEIDNLKWIDGLNRPTGMAEYQGHLYVVDLDRIHQIDLSKGTIIKSFLSETAKSLNDIAISKEGKMYISDVMSGTIYTNQADQIIPWTEPNFIPNPNAMMIGKEYLYVGNAGEDMKNLRPGNFGTIYKVSYDDKSINPVKITESLGVWDGLIKYKDGLLGSSPASGEIWHFNNEEKLLIATLEKGPADFGFDEENDIIYIPFLFNNKVVAYQIKE